jgi:hypothetical protein
VKCTYDRIIIECGGRVRIVPVISRYEKLGGSGKELSQLIEPIKLDSSLNAEAKSLCL